MSQEADSGWSPGLAFASLAVFLECEYGSCLETSLSGLVGKGRGSPVAGVLGCVGLEVSGLWEHLPFGGTRHFLPSFIFYHSYFWE